jgi:RNA polymerase sigma-70 factor (sigma-E family)
VRALDRDVETVFAEHGRALLRTAYLLCGDEHLAEDLVQTALLKALRIWRRSATAEQPRAYLRRVLVNEYVSWHRRRSTHERPTVTAALDRPGPDPTARVDDRDEAWRLLALLPRRQRAVLVLRLYEDLTDADIAAVLGCSTGTVRAHASYGLATLRDRITTSQITTSQEVS